MFAPISLPVLSPVLDTFRRPLRDLRVSVTDRCNFRCTYCMPKEVFGRDFAFLPPASLLSFEEITRLARVFTGLGVEKIRLTGGEPLVRRDVETAGLHAECRLPGLRDLTLTTNGALLAKKAQALKDAGLNRVTVSLDSLDDAVFQSMNDVAFPVARVLDGIAAAQAAGLGPVKINMVVQRGVNEDSVVPMARYFHGTAASCASSSSWTWARRTAGTSATSSPPPRSSAASAKSFPWSPRPRTTPARSPGASGTRTGAARSASSRP